MPRSLIKAKDLKNAEKAKFKIRWTPKKLLILGISVMFVYGLIVSYIVTSINIPTGLLLILIALPIITFGGYSLLYFATKNLG
jgi:hypothetical protein